ncbi:solute carrier family 2, facilitated glucose transporter member 1 isoform X2 [Phlebotomus argentipes]|uniref:solute carrier family 2, facilitated glucose transporter member 1 isoform X2 n=1 Tax=Phlebotomus argentipes TaxID=94469 RepID=UPI0028929F1B|nr:solute carrier family 2, facilitated glucose transporter member 1 isoform X2 [Phlebotomus argentipes]
MSEQKASFLPPSPQSEQSRFNEVEKMGFLLMVVALSTTFGTAVPVGYTIGVVNAPAEYMRSWCNASFLERYGVTLTDNSLDILWASIVSVFLIGGCAGSLGGAWIADNLGRKKSLLVCGALFVLAAIFFIFCRAANSVEMLIIGRLIVGFASGLTTATLPMYLLELAPLALRGTLGVFCSIGVTGGVVVGQVFSLQEIFGTDELWHWALSFYVVLVIICFLAAPWWPESPKYLYLTANRKDEAKNVLLRLRGNDPSFVQCELEEMNQELVEKSDTRSVKSVICDPALLLPIVLVCALQGGQQLSGINAVFYYSVSIFESAGLSSTNAKWANLGAGCLNLATAFFTPLLMKHFNRRPISLISCLGSGIFLFILTFVVNYIDFASWMAYACITCVLLYILLFAIGLGPIPFFLGSELCGVSHRAAIMALGSLANWAGNFVVGISFPILQTLWGAWVFLPFVVTCILLIALIYVYLPETRGKQASDVALLVAKGFKSKPLEM